MATHDGKCERHRRKAWANKSRRNEVLDPTLWRRAATSYLVDHPYCAGCGSDRDLQVDHITEVADGGALYDESNFQTLCGTCHIRKSRVARELRKQQRMDDAAGI